jgi:transposase
MAIIKHFDKRSGITYVYESISYWDKEKQQPRSKRTLIGRIDKETGNMVPTDGRGKKRNQTIAEDKPKQGPVPTETVNRRFYGATYLFDQISDKLGVAADLKSCFPDTFKQILSIAYYMILEDHSPLSRFERWNDMHKHPYAKNISSQRSSELFGSITEEQKNKYFALQGKRNAEDEYWAYDTTSISSYSEVLKQAQYGNNKEDDRLPQINLALVFGEKSGLPFYYRKLAGNIPDVKTVQNLLCDLSVLGFNKVKLVMDRGFYSEANINALFREHLKFIVAAKTSLSFVRRELDKIYDELATFPNLDEQYGVYSQSVMAEWDYVQERPYKGDVLKDRRRVYIHLYYNIDKAAEDQRSFDRKLLACRQELLDDHRIPEHESFYKKYFEVKETPKRGIQVEAKQEAVNGAKRYYGYFALLSNEKMDSIAALELYRNKDLVEKAFGNLKERLNMRRTLVSSEKSLDGKLFTAFVGLEILSYIKMQMQRKKLFADYTLQSLLDKLDVIECFENPGYALRVGEILENQKKLYEAMNILPPG